MNHKWKDDVCVKCGLRRERKEYKKPGMPYAVLGRDGCWYDKVPYTFGIGWHYGKRFGFERPPCPIELPNDERTASQQVMPQGDAAGLIK